MNMIRQPWNRTEGLSDPFCSSKPQNLKVGDEVRRLLEMSPHSVNDDSPLVSPEGVGCSVSSILSMSKPVGETLQDTLYHPNTTIRDSPFAKRLPPTTQPAAVGRLGSRLRPEDDILNQWRLRRKLEQSGNSNTQLPGLHMSAATPLSSPSSMLQLAPKHLTRDLNTAGNAHESPFPQTFLHPTVSQVPPNYQTSPQTSHFMVGLPSFPHNPAHVYPTDSAVQQWQNFSGPFMTPQTSENISQHRQNSSGPVLCSQSSEEQQHTKNTSDKLLKKVRSFSDDRLSKNKDGHYVVARKLEKGKQPAAAQQGGKSADDTSKRRDEAVSRGPKSSRHDKHENRKAPPDPALGRADQKVRRSKWQAELQRKEKSQKTSTLPHSPLHTAVGMVVSEVCFPDSRSADSPTSASVTDSSEDSHSFLPQTSSTPQRLQRPSEIIEKLLQEADDSEESDFENDPVLLVLREQRRSVKQRICEMDMLLESWKDTQP